MLSDAAYTVRLPLPFDLVRGRANTLTWPVYRSGALVAPAAAKLTVYDGSGVAVPALTDVSATIPNSVPTYTIEAGILSSYPFSDRWQVDASITLDDGTILSPRNDAALVRSGLWPVVTDADLIRRCPALDPQSEPRLTTATTYQDALDEAWTEIQLRLIAKGNRPNLVLEPSALRSVHLYLALALVFESEGTNLNTYGDRSAYYRSEYEKAWTDLNPRYSNTDEVTADARRRSMTPTIWLCGGAGRTTRSW